MSRDKVIGFAIFAVSVIIAVLYGWAMVSGHGLLTLKVVVSLGVLFIIAISAWLGIEMMRTPSLEEIEKKGKKKK